jgi:hypothetical protein
VDERPEQIEDHIRSTQRELGSNLQELENKVKDATNWRVQFERHPAAFLGIAFAGGLLLSAGLGGRRRRTSTDYRSWAPAAPYMRGPDLRNPANDPGFEPKEKSSDVWHGIKGALLAAAGTHVSNVLSEFLPGLKEQSPPESDAAQPSAPANGSAGRNGVHEEVGQANGAI